MFGIKLFDNKYILICKELKIKTSTGIKNISPHDYNHTDEIIEIIPYDDCIFKEGIDLLSISGHPVSHNHTESIITIKTPCQISDVTKLMFLHERLLQERRIPGGFTDI